MKQLIENRLKGIFRSYKIFRHNGDVVIHTIDNFQEWDFNDNHVLTIGQYQQNRKKIICQTNQWTLAFENKRHFINIDQPTMRLEIITINHTGMVIENSTPGEKVFFARYPAWESFVRSHRPIM